MSLPKSRTFSRGIVDGMSGVHTGPGATAFTRTPRSAASCASDIVMFVIAAFVAAYGKSCPLGCSAWIDVVLMIVLPGRMCGSAALLSQKSA